MKNVIYFIKKYKLLIILLLFLCFAIPYTYAKYISSLAGSASSHIDKVYYDIIADSENDTDLSDGTATYYFDVVNYDKDDNLNEVLMKYYILINLPPVDISSDCTSLASHCDDALYVENLKEQCPVTCGYVDGISSINFNKHLYYLNSSNAWVEIPINTSGTYNGYFTGYKNMVFNQKEVHKYKFVFSTTDNIVVTKNYPFSVQIKYVQTQS